MFQRNCFIVAMAAIALFEAVFFYLVAGIDNIGQGIILAPIVVLSMWLGLDICRQLCISVLSRFVPRAAAVPTTIIVCLLVLPIPLMLVLWASASLTASPIGLVDGLFEAWRTATRVGLLHCFLAYCGYPCSLRSLANAYRKALESDLLCAAT